MPKTFLAFATLAGLAMAPVQAQEPASGPSPEVPELAVLSSFVGQWDDQFEAKPIPGVSEGVKFKGTATAEWVLDGRFLRQSWSSVASGGAPKLSGFTTMTYDPEKKAYRSWNFMSTGSVSEGEGQYDEKTKTITWTAREANGLQTTTKATFPEEGVETWTIVVKDGEGRVVADLVGKNVRKKK